MVYFKILSFCLMVNIKVFKKFLERGKIRGVGAISDVLGSPPRRGRMDEKSIKILGPNQTWYYAKKL